MYKLRNLTNIMVNIRLIHLYDANQDTGTTRFNTVALNCTCCEWRDKNGATKHEKRVLCKLKVILADERARQSMAVSNPD